jgi:hypothetical protein
MSPSEHDEDPLEELEAEARRLEALDRLITSSQKCHAEIERVATGLLGNRRLFGRVRSAEHKQRE